MRTKIKTIAELRAFIAEHPRWVLQYNSGIRSDGWWWMREKSDRGEVRKVHATAARSVSKGMKYDASLSDWMTKTYVGNTPS